MENNELTQRFGVTNYPTLIYIVGVCTWEVPFIVEQVREV